MPPQQLSSEWYRLALRLQQKAKNGGYNAAVIKVTIIAGEDGKPMFWGIDRQQLEPRGSEVRVNQVLKGL